MNIWSDINNTICNGCNNKAILLSCYGIDNPKNFIYTKNKPTPDCLTTNKKYTCNTYCCQYPWPHQYPPKHSLRVWYRRILVIIFFVGADKGLLQALHFISHSPDKKSYLRPTALLYFLVLKVVKGSGISIVIIVWLPTEKPSLNPWLDHHGSPGF